MQGTDTRTQGKRVKASTGRRMKKTSKPPKLHRVLPKLVFLLLVFTMILGLKSILFSTTEEEIPEGAVAVLALAEIPDWIEVDIIPLESDSREGEYLAAFNGVVVHYVGNAGTTAAQNRSYYANPATEVNSHFLIDLDGSILLCIPLIEKSAASNDRNIDTISIEVCHPDESGEFTEESYESLVKLTAWLMDLGDLSEDDLLRHYDITGKLCPITFVDETVWGAFKEEVLLAREGA